MVSLKPLKVKSGVVRLQKQSLITKTLSRRKNTLFTKAYELHIVRGAPVRVEVHVPNSDNRYLYRSDGLPAEKNQPKQSSVEQTQPGPSTGPRYPSPSRPVCQLDATTQTVSVYEEEDKCRMCGEGQLRTRALWVGCSQPKCNFWVHARCLHLRAKSQRALSKIEWFCPQHWREEIN